MLDNCEHLVHGVARFVDRLLRSNAAIRVLATSREPLLVEGEVIWRVPSLAVPPDDVGFADGMEKYDAVQLFAERAGQARPGFRINDENGLAVAQICQRLDGLPLAIELAAARVRVSGPERIAAELDDRFRLLASHNRVGVARQQTLLASVDWSHELLSVPEQVLLRRLGVFAGGFTLHAAETVASEAPLTKYERLEVLGRLVDKSLVQADDDLVDGGRYRLLETIRHYGLARLAESGEAAAIQDRHLAWARRLASEQEAEAANGQATALDRLDLEHANLRAALEWATAGDRRAEAYALVADLALFWAQRGQYREAAAWEARLFTNGDPPEVGSVARARWGCAYVRYYGADFLGASRQAATALVEARAGGDDSTAARCLHAMNIGLLFADPIRARERSRRGRRVGVPGWRRVVPGPGSADDRHDVSGGWRPPNRRAHPRPGLRGLASSRQPVPAGLASHRAGMAADLASRVRIGRSGNSAVPPAWRARSVIRLWRRGHAAFCVHSWWIVAGRRLWPPNWKECAPPDRSPDLSVRPWCQPLQPWPA